MLYQLYLNKIGRKYGIDKIDQFYINQYFSIQKNCFKM